jgi:hypothetical protein
MDPFQNYHATAEIMPLDRVEEGPQLYFAGWMLKEPIALTDKGQNNTYACGT